MEHKDKPEAKRGSEAVFARRVVVAVSVILLFAFIYYIRHLFVYLTFAVLLAYIAAGPVELVHAKTKMRKGLSILAVLLIFLLLMTGVCLLIIPPLSSEFTLLVDGIPDTLHRLETFVNGQLARWSQAASQTFTIQSWFDNMFKYLESNLTQIAGQVFSRGLDVVTSVGSFLLGLVIVPITAYYFLKDSRVFRKSIERLVGGEMRPVLSDAIERVNSSLGGYVRGQILLCLIYGFIATIGLAILGVKYPLFLGVFVGLTGIIPIVGPVMGFVPAVILALAESPWLAFKVIILLIVIRLADDYFIAPRVMGHTMKLHPLTVIISMMIGAHVAGVVGMLLALPIAAVLKVVVEIYLARNGSRDEPDEQPSA